MNNIKIGKGIFKSLNLIQFGDRIAIITDEQVANLYGHDLLHRLLEEGIEATLLTFAGGESSKTRETKEKLEDQLFEKRWGRDTVVVGLGGGIVTDMAGYIAATFCRGVSYIAIPTTLMGMVDASIGGKTGVNHPHGKNLIGCIYPPHQIYIDPQMLDTLDQKEISNGMSEMIKHGVIADSSFFEFLENSYPIDYEEAIYRSCRIKAAIVAQDEKENGKRRLLNFGHTIGHALEKASHYTLPHGHAIAIGMHVEAQLAHKLGYNDVTKRLIALLNRYRLPYEIPCDIPQKDILHALAFDKKSLKSTPRFVIVSAIGSADPFKGAYCTSVDENLLQEVLTHARSRH